MSYLGDVFKKAKENENFRKVLFTGKNSQLVVMSVPPQEEIGEETHPRVEQTLFFLSGTGRAVLDGKVSQISAGSAVVVTPGTKHNFFNTGVEPLTIITVYSPPNHIDGRIHRTKKDADQDLEDERFGESRGG
ncbi:MAG: cupin domain-containing protein [Patescibacteria group bacterium]|nr:cupin domain-containing protein [Patescibacteria group bacterium]